MSGLRQRCRTLAALGSAAPWPASAAPVAAAPTADSGPWRSARLATHGPAPARLFLAASAPAPRPGVPAVPRPQLASNAEPYQLCAVQPSRNSCSVHEVAGSVTCSARVAAG